MNRMQAQVAQRLLEREPSEVSVVPRLPVEAEWVFDSSIADIKDALKEGNMPIFAIGLAQLAYQAFGFAVMAGIDLEPFFNVFFRDPEMEGCFFDEVDNILKFQKSSADCIVQQIEQLRQTNAWEDITPEQFQKMHFEGIRRFWAMRRVDDFTSVLDAEYLAQVAREAFNRYAQSTLKNPPADFVKSWDETGDWGRGANLAVANAVTRSITQALVEYEAGVTIDFNAATNSESDTINESVDI